MKKSLFVVAMASLALASCSKDEQSKVAAVNPDVITFKSSVLSVRGTEIGNDLSSMYVTAFDKNGKTYFNETTFNRDGATNSFKSNPEYRWPGDGGKVKFYCYAPEAAKLGGTMSLTDTEKKLSDFAPKAAVKDQLDFIVAYADGTKGDGNGVDVKFMHQLTQIKLKAMCKNATYTCKIAGVRIARPVSKGTFTFPEAKDANGSWTLSQNDADKVIYEYALPNEINLTEAAQSLMADNGGAMLIPQSITSWDPTNNPKNEAGKGRGAYLSMKLVATSTTGGQVLFSGWSAVPFPANTTLEAGKTYEYTLDYSNGLGKVDPESPDEGGDKPKPGDDILGGNISFRVNVTDWDVVDRKIDLK